jgi:hypothetical protein
MFTKKDLYTMKRPEGYHNGLLGSPEGIMELLTKYAICPSNDVEGYRGSPLSPIATGRDMANLHPNRTALVGSSRDLEVGSTSVIKTAQVENDNNGHTLVAYIKLGVQQRGSWGVTGNEGGDRISFKMTYKPTAGYVPVYFLPWDSDGGAVRITIPPMGVNPTDPNVFFTAAINGCSVFFQGTRQNPTIYHCGGSTGYTKAQMTERVQFWDEVMEEFLAMDQAAGRNLGNMQQQKVDLTDYVATPGVQMSWIDANGANVQVVTTPRAKQYQEQLLSAQQKTSLTIETVSPWGCVMGCRDTSSGDWTFYLQENATIIYHRIKRSPFNRKGTQTETQMVARPLQFREIFPAGAGHACIQAPLPKIR